MLIWGRKAVRRHLGYAADFCPICATARPFAVSRVGMAGHVYYITAGDGDLVGYERACMVCTIALKADPAQYAEMSPTVLGISALAKQTFPNFAAVYRERMALEKVIRLDPTMLNAADRQALIMQPFTLLSVKVSEHFDKSAFGSGGTFVQREVLPILARAMRRLRPTESELKAALARLVQMKEVIGNKVKLPDLLAEINRKPGPDSLVIQPHARSPAVAVGDEARRRNNAGRVLRVLAYIAGAGVVGLWLASLLPDTSDAGSTTFRFVLLVAAALAYGVYRAGQAVAQGKVWGRQAGMLLAALLLLAFPIGTAVGGYLLWTLGRQWVAADHGVASSR